MSNKYLCCSFLLLLLFGCKSTLERRTEKIQKHRKNIVNVSEKIIDIKPEIIFGNSSLYILGDILILEEKSPKNNKGIHLFDKNTFKYLTSTCFIGKGPGEITNPGPLGLDKKNRIFWVPDGAKHCIYKFPIDSVLTNNNFKPSTLIKLIDNALLDFGFLNDSIVLGNLIRITSDTQFETVVSKLNIKSNQIESFGYKHFEAKGQSSISLLAISPENDVYVNCFFKRDLMTICDLTGNLKFNVFGPGWYDSNPDINSYFMGVDFFEKNIIASYVGSESIINNGNITWVSSPSKLIIFDLNGNYLQTLDTKYQFDGFCIDNENKRIIICFNNRKESLGYFNITF